LYNIITHITLEFKLMPFIYFLSVALVILIVTKTIPSLVTVLLVIAAMNVVGVLYLSLRGRRWNVWF